jgi:anti-anti-sigma factor
MTDRLDELVVKLKDSSKDVVKASIVEAIGQIQDPRAVKPLIEALNDEEMLVRWNAIKGLARFGEDAVAPLLRAMDTADRFKRRNVVQALGELGGDEVVDRLIRMLMFDESDQMVQVEVIRALDRIRDARSVDPLITVLKMDNWEMRWRTIHALEHLGDPRAIEPLLEVMNDGDKDIQWAAYMAIEGIKSARDRVPADAAATASETDPAPRPTRSTVKEQTKNLKPDLSLSAETKPDRVIIRLVGDLFSSNIDMFTGYVDGIISVNKTGIELDMSQCAFLDSFALSRLNIMRKKLTSKNRKFILSGMKPNVKAVFTATKLDQLFEIR